ncbi:3-oxoadipate enol-lactonase [Deinococcus sp.]|uniref:bifunctional 3-oxoadipate enol-lactonase/4-carboxymuconolactone decarboxylase PcaDC n=1 Tax=Deinococcus sp. TaxID=47478 RepID=UPI002869CE96|nr:3-oxoadipate enol-lactonase [Deinococcus sp.]
MSTAPPFIDVHGVSLCVRPRPRPSARTVVFLNSLGSDGRIWDDVAADLHREYATVQYDKRGHGLSDAPPAPYTIRDHTDDLAGLLDALGIDRAVLVGVSVGGLIAQDFASAYPLRVEGLVLCDTGAKIGTAELWNPRIEAAQSGKLAGIAPTVLGRWFTPAFFEARPAEARGYLNMLARTTPDGYAGTCAALRDTDLRQQTAALKVPTVVLCGAEDQSTPPDLNRELAGLLGADLHLIPGAAHLPSVEQPQAVIDHIRTFLNGLDGTAASTYDAGMSVRRRVLGDAHVDRATVAATDFDRDFQRYITEIAWGGPWARPGLSTHTRHLLTLAILTALPREHELEMHVRATRNTGVTPDELREVFMHTGVYAGVPVANRAFQIARRVLAEPAPGET